ncbi:MAG: TldD/PmbA family protein [Firmicutes bacterium]|nr:TldD/PmbA family protein [Bacillota bacterium]
MEEYTETNLRFQGPTLETVNMNTRVGGCVRALVSGGWGFTTFNNLDDLEQKVDMAIRQAKLVGEVGGNSILAPVPVVEDEVRPKLLEDPSKVDLASKVDLFQGYNEIVLGHGGTIVSSSINYFDRHGKVPFANSEGTYILQHKTDLAGSVFAMAGDGETTQTSRVTFGSSNDFGVCRNLDDDVRKACTKATELLAAPPVKGGEYTVVIDPTLAGIFAHEAFGHLSESDFLYENPNLQKVMQLGTKFGEDFLTIYDTGLDEGARGYLMYDDEGVATERTDLIREGVLVGRLHTRETAAKLGEKPTGNARAINYNYAPICRMRNTCIAPGEASFEDMLSGLKEGIYVKGSFGGETNGEMFTFSAAEAYMIRNGQLAELVRDVNLTGNVFTTLANIEMVGKDFQAHESAGGCGKGNQAPLPTSEWAPHVRIRNVVIGGCK